MRYIVRQESTGAFVFDKIERFVFHLTQDELESILRAKNSEDMPKILQASLATKEFFLDKGQANFSHIQPSRLAHCIVNHSHLVAPNRLYLELTRACNLRCKMCYNAAGCALPNELTTGQFKDLLDQMAEIGIFEVRLTGGEPTQRLDFFTILDYAIAKGFYVSLATNGVWDQELRRQVAKRKIDDVIISLEGPEEINDRFRAGGGFQSTLETIRALKKAGMKKVRINTVLSKENWQHIESLFQLCKEYDLLLIDFIHPRPFGRGATNSAQEITLSAEDTLEFNRLTKKLRQKYPGVKVVMDFDLLAEEDLPLHPIVPRIKACPAGREFAFVSPQGNLFPCGVAPVHDIGQMSSEEKEMFIAGNVLEKSILELWHQSSVWDSYRDLARCKPSECFSCQFWGKKCFGTCPIGAYYATGKLNGSDPYCYAHLLQPKKE